MTGGKGDGVNVVLMKLKNLDSLSQKTINMKQRPEDPEGPEYSLLWRCGTVCLIIISGHQFYLLTRK